ncbi:hypothetical protein [Acetonema longum]|nr:hypothetical protein [Acetonema longum]
MSEQDRAILDRFISVIKFIPGLFIEDVSVMVADTEKFIMYLPSKKTGS